MSKWMRVLNPQSKLIPKNTLGEVSKEDKDYYYIKHFKGSGEFQELKTNCERHYPPFNQTVVFNNENYKIISYAEDFPTGEKTFTPVTGLRVNLQAINPEETFDNAKEEYVTTLLTNVN